MQLSKIDRVQNLSKEEFTSNYLVPQRPVIVEQMSATWPAIEKWTWDFFKNKVGDVSVRIYNNTRAGAHVPVNGGDGEMLFGDYLDIIRDGPSDLRLFLFNIFKYAPELKNDFIWPSNLISGLLKFYPMLFVGGAGSIAHMHYDLDLAHIFHTQFLGKKKVLLFPYSEQHKLYRMPLTVESAANFANWEKGLDMNNFPSLKKLNGYTETLHHGDTLFMPSKMWHHMEYLESGFGMSLRAMPSDLIGKLNSIYHLILMRGMNNILIKTCPKWWYHKKRSIAMRQANFYN